MQKEKSKRQTAKGSTVACPFCGSAETRREANFGTTLGYAQFYCCACRTPFEWIKWEENAPPADLPAFLAAPKNLSTPD
jgi:hypothetical protein